MQIYAATNKDDAEKRGWLRNIPVSDIVRWAQEFSEYCDVQCPKLAEGIAQKKELTAELKAELNKVIGEFNAVFQTTPGAKL